MARMKTAFHDYLEQCRKDEVTEEEHQAWMEEVYQEEILPFRLRMHQLCLGHNNRLQIYMADISKWLSVSLTPEQADNLMEQYEAEVDKLLVEKLGNPF